LNTRPGNTQPPIPEGLKGIPTVDGRSSIPWEFVRGAALSRASMVVALFFDHITGRDHYAVWMSQEAIARDSEISRRMVQFGVAELIAKGLIHAEWMVFRGRRRRVLYLLWKLPDTFEDCIPAPGPQPKPRPRLRIHAGANTCASSFPKNEVGACPIGANPCVDTAQVLAPPLPISNSVLSFEQTLTLAAPPKIEEAREPFTTPCPAPPPPQPPQADEPPPSPEQIAELERRAAGKGHDSWMAKARLGELLSAPLIQDLPLTPVMTSWSPPAPPRPEPPACASHVETDDLWRRLGSGGGRETVEAVVARMVERCKDPDWAAIWRKHATAVQSGDVPLKIALKALRRSRSETAISPGAVFAATIREWRESHSADRGRLRAAMARRE
jgi:hypothetical protein